MHMNRIHYKYYHIIRINRGNKGRYKGKGGRDDTEKTGMGVQKSGSKTKGGLKVLG